MLVAALGFPVLAAGAVVGAKPQRALRATPQLAVMPADSPMMVVRVPVVEVVMMEPMEMESAAKKPMPPRTKAQSQEDMCEREMMGLMLNRSRALSSRACETKGNFSQHAIEKLQKSDLAAAFTFIEKTFHECGGLSKECAAMTAKDVELKMRLSGVAIEKQCMEAAHKMKSKEGKEHKSHPCEDNATKSMVGELAKDDLEGAMLAAQRGLHMCNAISTPCDFQLAPMLAMEVMDAQEEKEEQAMIGALLSGLRKSAEHSAKIASLHSADKPQTNGHVAKPLKKASQKAEVAKMPEKKSAEPSPKGNSKAEAAKTSERKHAALSLLDFAENVRITSQKRIVKF